MSAFRKEILDILENELKNPSTFLKQMLESSKNGMTSLCIIQQMSKDLCHIPLDYIIHCIKKDDRFAFDPFQVKVCLNSQLKTKLTKTTPYGTIDPEDDDDDYYETKQDKEKEKAAVYPEYKTPFFKPMFSTTEKIFPIFFDNETFYVDDLPENQVNPEEPNVVVPEFDLYDITPLTNDEETLGIEQGLPNITGECFNCGSTQHKFTECPEPTNLKRVKEKRRKVNSREKFDRLYKELKIRNRVNLFTPGEISSTLRDALGMDEVQEPPYYKKMRTHGYPPGYLIHIDPLKPIPTFQSLNERNFKLEIEELKVFDDAYISGDEDKKVDTEAKTKPRKTIEIKLVDYGVDFDKIVPEQEQEQGVIMNELDAAIQRYNSIRSETNSNNDPSLNSHHYPQQQNVNSYQSDYPHHNSQDAYSYYYGYYDYSAYQQYNAYPPSSLEPPPVSSLEPPPSSSSEPPPPSSHLPLSYLPPPPPAPPSQTYSDPSNCQPTPTITNYTPPQPNTSQSNQLVYDDNDSVDMEISDDDDDS